ncbi:MAG: transcriptional regulator HexR [Halieaceae bacterium]|jgi:RpiR family carbohydrate utilization transcriptional regulator|uniref:Transcriptional regulator, RpiR family n=2 Tax=Bacteria TaxID=2 RepID=Q8RTT4_9PROT|nr:transcriptional regulator, RpiR family [uncultured marine proteobacterium]AAR38289.1 transcriptional regulator, RpiR family [uncultured marine bacterium 581]EAW41179.1 Transcriptional regulator [marine gamma proteobacterium HTCC2080]MBT4855272.1 transcriptional regulator HexR [Halieaceae bacterium]MDG1828378.1 transcriptional regulator HexR [Luminiphilus sp.]
MANDTNVLTQIQAALPGLSKSDTKIAHVVLADPEAATHASIALLAQQANVSEPSVNRFCKRLGATGYPDFKIWLARSLVAGVRYISQVVDPEDTVTTYPGKLVDNTVNALLLAREQLPLKTLEVAVEHLDAAGRIYFFGMGTSAAVAQDAEHKFFRFQTPVTTHTDPLMLRMLAAGGSQGDVFVFISHTGRTEAIVDAAALASASGATVISLTAQDSPLAQVSHCVIGLEAPENTEDYLPMTSRIVHLVIIDILVTGVTLKRGEPCIEHLARIKESLLPTRLPLNRKRTKT